MIRFIELFAGIGGFRYGLEVVNLGCQKARNEGMGNSIKTRDSGINKIGRVQPQRRVYTCVWANEINKYACQIYRKNFGDKELYEGDITKVDTRLIPDHDLLCGGTPCQSFSIAGNRGGFEDTRGTLFYDYARILAEKKPRYFIFENVKGILSHDGGQTFTTIIRVFSDIGYDLQWEVLNSKNYGVPQNRERVFIIGHLRGTSRPEVFPIGEDDQLFNKKVNADKGQSQTKFSTPIRPDIGTKADSTFVTRMPLKFLGRNEKNYKKDEAYTIDGANTGGVALGPRIRRLTPTECERLQGFPDGWTEKGIDNKGNCVTISDTQRYKTLGNAVTTNVIKEIVCRLVRCP